MNISVLIFGILPLLAFVVIDSFAGLRAGIIGGILFALAETVYSLVFYQTIDELTLGSTALVVFFGLVSYKSQKEIYFKLQPVLVALVFSIVFGVMQVLGKPLLVTMIQKYQFMLPEQMRLLSAQQPMLTLMARLSGILAYGFLIHAIFVAYAAFCMSKWWWLIIRGIGLYFMLFICVVLVRLS